VIKIRPSAPDSRQAAPSGRLATTLVHHWHAGCSGFRRGVPTTHKDGFIAELLVFIEN
jgi:hypothetical protein